MYATGMRYYAMDLPKLLAKREAERLAKEEEIRRIADLGERVRRLRLTVPMPSAASATPTLLGPMACWAINIRTPARWQRGRS